MNIETYSETYTSFSGADIRAYTGSTQFATLQAISYSITREKGPVYTMLGSPDPFAYARGKRAVAGSLIFLTISEQALLSHMKKAGQAKFYSENQEIRYDKLDPADIQAVFRTATVDTYGEQVDAWYADQILPFTIQLVAANEYGKAMRRSFYGVEILNEGGGVSVDDLALEESYTFVARGCSPWTAVSTGSPASANSSGTIV